MKPLILDIGIKVIVGVLIIQPIIYFVKKSRKWFKNFNNKKSLQKLQNIENMRKTDLLINFLIFRYEKSKKPPIELMHREIYGHEIIIPVKVLYSNIKPLDVNIFLGTVDVINRHVEDNLESSAYLKHRKILGTKTWNKPNYELTYLEENNEMPKINGGITNYLSCLSSQDELEFELLTKLKKYQHNLEKTNVDWNRFSKKLKYRNKIENKNVEWVKSNYGRYNGIAVSTLIIYKDMDNKYCILCGKRSSKTAVHGSLYHVIPAGMFQPELADPKQEWDIKHAIFKEYGEELFNKKINDKAIKHDYFYSEWECVSELINKLQMKDHVQLIPTGIILNLLNLRPEICTLLLIHDSEWWSKQVNKMETNWEYCNRSDINDTNRQSRTFFNLDSVEKQFFENDYCEPGCWVPPGLAAFWLGIDAAKEIIEL